MNLYEILIDIMFPPMILILGLIGNSTGYLVMKRPKLVQIGPRNIYKYLFIIDSIYLVQIVINYLQFGFKIDLSIYSRIGCKLWFYINYGFGLVYISMDRFISIKYPAKRYMMRKRNNQLIFLIFTVVSNLLYYLPVVYNYNILIVTNTTNGTAGLTVCTFIDLDSQNVVAYMDLANRALLPFILILIFSVLLTIEIFKSRKRILEHFNVEDNRYYYNEIRLSITSLCLNFIYCILQMPISIYDLIPEYYLLPFYSFTYFLFYLSYAINSYVILFSNSLFRDQCFLFFREFYLVFLNKF